MGNRDIGLDRGRNGKGDKNRSDPKAFRDGYSKVEWPVAYLKMEQRGRKLVKRYGPAARPTIETIHMPPAPVGFYLPDEMRPPLVPVKLKLPSGILK